MSKNLGLRLAGGTLVLTGLGFGLPCIWGIWHFYATGEVLMFLGYPTYGEGPFESLGLETTVPLLAAFLAVCLFEVLAGVRTWGAHRDGTVLALALLPVEFAFWYGFSLPVPPPLALARTILIFSNWRRLRR